MCVFVKEKSFKMMQTLYQIFELRTEMRTKLQEARRVGSHTDVSTN